MYTNLCSFFFLSHIEKCIKEYYSNNKEQKISFVKKKCLHIVKFYKLAQAWLRLWFEPKPTNREKPVNLVVILKDSQGKERRTWNLASKYITNFAAEKKGDWFEVKELESRNYYSFSLKFKLYYAGKDKYVQ